MDFLMAEQDSNTSEEFVPDEVIPHNTLPPLKYRDMPEPVSWKKMIGPSVMLAGLSLGSGEFIIWPHIVYQSGFVFFWACMLGVITQYFLNMEIERWTLVTGESAITGFCRLSRHWAWIFLLLNILPWAWPGWATGAGKMISWILFGPGETADTFTRYFAIAGLILIGIVLTAGPVVYNTVEKIQLVLVGLILLLVAVIAIVVIRPDAITAMGTGIVNIGNMPELKDSPGPGDLTLMGLLGALAFAGAGGTTNLGQSNFIKDKGYGMGRYIGRITSPLTGQEEAAADIGFHFKHTPENMNRWRLWWRAANVEHFWSFLITCIVCLCLMSLISYSLFYDANGTLTISTSAGEGFDFVWAQADLIQNNFAWGTLLKAGFLVMGVAILLTTALGVLDAISRISTDIVKVNFLRDNENWSLSKLYFVFLWGEIALGVIILLIPGFDKPLFLLKLSAAMNGGVMLIYSVLLLYMNNKILSRKLSMSPVRFLAIIWSCAFFGYFSFQAMQSNVIPYLASLLNG
ncbi:MAG: hypothetical protein Tsb009_33300 [Planctomycetaceae bacterium]